MNIACLVIFVYLSTEAAPIQYVYEYPIKVEPVAYYYWYYNAYDYGDSTNSTTDDNTTTTSNNPATTVANLNITSSDQEPTTATANQVLTTVELNTTASQEPTSVPVNANTNERGNVSLLINMIVGRYKSTSLK